MTTDEQSCDCRGVLDRLDRIVELLEGRRKPSLAQEASDLIQQYEKGLITEERLKEQIAGSLARGHRLM